MSDDAKSINLEPTLTGYQNMRQMFREEILSMIPRKDRERADTLLNGVVEATKGVVQKLIEEREAKHAASTRKK